MSTTQTAHIPLSSSINQKLSKSHFSDGIHNIYLISLVQLYYDDYIVFLDKNDIDILKYSKLT